MPNITSCPNCGQLYDAGSEEAANEPLYGDYPPKGRWCPICFHHPAEAALRRRDREARESSLNRRALVDRLWPAPLRREEDQ